MQRKFATPILYAIDIFKNYDFFLYIHNHGPLIVYFVYFFENFNHLHFSSNFLVQLCVILVGNGIFSRVKKIIKFGYKILLCNRYHVYLLLKNNLIKVWPILVMQLRKCRLFSVAHGFQLDNGVTSTGTIHTIHLLSQHISYHHTWKKLNKYNLLIQTLETKRT